MSNYEIGEIVEIISCCGRFDGWAEREVILGPMKDGDMLFNPIKNKLERMRFEQGGNTPRYITTSGHATAESHMRKKRPKQQDNQSGTWNECPFIPEDIRIKQ